MADSAGLTQSEMRKRILDNLGNEALDIELGERQLDAAIRQGLQEYRKYQPKLNNVSFDVPAIQTMVVSLEDENKYPAAHRVLDVVWRERQDFVPHAGGIGQHEFHQLAVAGYGGIRFPRVVIQTHFSNHRHERFVQGQSDWFWDSESKNLYLYNPLRPRLAWVLFSQQLTVEGITVAQERDFEKLVTAKAKYILARTMGSLGEIPGPQGSITNDSDRLREEAKNDEEEVLKDLRKSHKSVPPPRYVG